MEMFYHKNRSIFSIGPHLLGLMFVATGLFAVASPLFRSDTSTERALAVGGGALLLGLLVLTTYGGTTIDFAGKRIKAYIAIAGFKMGQWAHLPQIKVVRLVEVVQNATNTPNGISPTLSGKVRCYNVMLFSGQARPAFTFSYPHKAHALEVAKALAENLHAVLEQISPPENKTNQR